MVDPQNFNPYTDSPNLTGIELVSPERKIALSAEAKRRTEIRARVEQMAKKDPKRIREFVDRIRDALADVFCSRNRQVQRIQRRIGERFKVTITIAQYSSFPYSQLRELVPLFRELQLLLDQDEFQREKSITLVETNGDGADFDGFSMPLRVSLRRGISPVHFQRQRIQEEARRIFGRPVVRKQEILLYESYNLNVEISPTSSFQTEFLIELASVLEEIQLLRRKQRKNSKIILEESALEAIIDDGPDEPLRIFLVKDSSGGPEVQKKLWELANEVLATAASPAGKN